MLATFPELKPASVFYKHAEAITTTLRTKGISEDILEMVEPTATPGPCSGLLASILAMLPSLLAGCIPVVKTPAGLHATWQKMQLPFRGAPLRTRLLMACREAITQKVGYDPDGQHVMGILLTPLKDSISAHCGTLTEADAAIVIEESNALNALPSE